MGKKWWKAGMVIVGVIACDLACGGAIADDPPTKQESAASAEAKEWAAKIDTMRKDRAPKLAAAVEEADVAVAATKANYKKAVSQQSNAVKNLKSQLDRDEWKAIYARRAVEANGTWMPEFDPNDAEAGSLGALRVGKFVPVFKVIQVVNASSAIVEHDDRIYWTEFTTKGLVDGDNITLQGLVGCTGTKQYTTALGTKRTVLILKTYDVYTRSVRR